MAIALDMSIEGLEGLKKFVDPKVYRKAMSRTLNDVAKQSATAASKEVRGEYNITARAIKETIKIKKAQANKLVAEMKYRVRRRGLALSKFKGTRPTKKRGVTYRVKLKDGRKRLPHAFRATMPSGHTGIFQRYGAPRVMKQGKYAGQMRQPIRGEFRADVVAMMRKAGVKAIEETYNKRLLPVFKRNLRFFQRRARG